MFVEWIIDFRWKDPSKDPVRRLLTIQGNDAGDFDQGVMIRGLKCSDFEYVLGIGLLGCLKVSDKCHERRIIPG